MSSRYMTLPEVAEQTGRPVAVLQHWARQGRIPAVKIGRSWVIEQRDLAAIEAMPRRKRR